MTCDRLNGSALALSLLFLSAGLVEAQPAFRPCAEIPDCAARYKDAQRLSKSGSHERALQLFLELHRQYGDPTALYPIAVMSERLGRPADAATNYQRYLDSGVETDPVRVAKIEEQLLQALALANQAPQTPKSSDEKLRPVAPPTMVPPQPVSLQRRDYLYFDIGIGGGFAWVAGGSSTEVAWFYNRAAERFEPARTPNGGVLGSGLGLRAEIGAFLWRGLSIGIAGHFEPYLGNSADSNENANLSPVCQDSRGNPSPCFGTTSKAAYGFTVLGKLRYLFQFRGRHAQWFRPSIHLALGGGEWRANLNIDGSRPANGGVIDNSSPYQPTDQCSATYNGKTDTTRDPPACSSIGGNVGYNQRDSVAKSVPPTNLNPVCPVNGPCIDSVRLGTFMLSAGAGLYVGGRHAGGLIEFDLTSVLGGQTGGILFYLYGGPEFIF